MSAGRRAPVTVRYELQLVTGDIKSSMQGSGSPVGQQWDGMVVVRLCVGN